MYIKLMCILNHRIKTLLMKFQFPLIIFLLLFSAGEAISQSFQSASEHPVAVSIVGGSTLHDWTVACGTIEEYPTSFDLTVKEGSIIDSFTFSVQVKSMEGGRGSIMNTKIFNALKSEEHPNVKYQQTTPATISSVDGDGNFTLTSTGLLQMAGQEKEVSVSVTGQLKDNVLVFTGSHPMKLSDFEIDPPSAMFGQIQTKDDITVNFEFRYTTK